MTGDTSGPGHWLAPEAQTSLAQMVMSLSQPFGYKVAPVSRRSPIPIVSVAVEIDDRVRTGSGELVEMVQDLLHPRARGR